MNKDYFVHKSSFIDEDVKIGKGTNKLETLNKEAKNLFKEGKVDNPSYILLSSVQKRKVRDKDLVYSNIIAPIIAGGNVLLKIIFLCGTILYIKVKTPILNKGGNILIVMKFHVLSIQFTSSDPAPAKPK